jgi:hypothetical protein
MLETSQMGLTDPVRPWQPLSLSTGGADAVSPAQCSGLCSNSVDKKNKHNAIFLLNQ